MSGPHVRTRRRALLPWLAPAAGMTVLQLTADPWLARHGVPLVARWPLEALVAATLMLPPATAIETRTSDNFDWVRHAFQPGAVATACTAALAGLQLIVNASGTPPPGGTLVVVGGLVVAWTATYGFCVASQPAIGQRLLRVRHEPHAAKLLSLCERALAEPGPDTDADRRQVLELNAATALIALSTRTDGEDRLDEAFAMIERAATTAPPPLAFAAARRMVDGMRAKAERTGDDVGWDQAIAMLGQAAARLPEDEVDLARGLVHAERAERLEWRAAPARANGARDVLIASAMRELEIAQALTDERFDHHALYGAQRTRLRASQADDADLDDAIRQLSAASRRLRNAADPHHHDAARIALADLLMRRAAAVPYGATGRAVMEAFDGHPLQRHIQFLWIDRETNDLIRAMVLLLSVDERTYDAADRMPELRDRMNQVMRFGRMPRWVDRHTGWMFRLIARQQAGDAADRAAANALKWGDWAEVRGDTEQAADAAWRWVTAGAADLRRRVMQDKEPRVHDLQQRFVQAADRLARAGRTAEAAIALDRGRAVLLTERTGRAREGLQARLETAGRRDLAERWRALTPQVEQADRAAFGGVLGRGDARGSDEYRALAKYDALVHEIAALPGFADVDDPPDYDDLRAAAADGPLVYVVALADRGFALVVTADADAPALVALPDLDRRWAEAASARMGALKRGRPAARRLGPLLERLWTRVLEPVTNTIMLPLGTLVTLVPVGPLADLPLHAAATAPGLDGLWHDRLDGVAFRYAPNARVLRHARRAAAAHRADAVLTAHGAPPALVGAEESDAVARLATAAGVDTDPVGASADRLLAGLDASGLWHLACHGRHEPGAPLESALELDRPLTLRELFVRHPGGGRLALLSSCWGTRLAQDRRDEVVGFPSAMLQAGVAGVVSCQGEVDEEAIKLLTLDLLGRVFDGASPPRALADAQAWLRTATNAELRVAFPYAYKAPAGIDQERWAAHRPFTEPWTWVLVNYTGA